MRSYLPHLPKSSVNATVAATTIVRQVHGAYTSRYSSRQCGWKLTRTPLTSISSRILWCLPPGAVGITRSPSWKLSSTDSNQKFHNLFHALLAAEGLATCLLPPL
ncbi:hypothetical protein CSKR_100365 [Clonorchis sinensis]|uniref:Uncharacterized protein n=1 Tax=Clonorchis sinensis TaxID=79923 RepID=A0A3R7JH38_CLOSI|nr:hypothetical protein CSKR_100365 [Clonorchis sinensis]